MKKILLLLLLILPLFGFNTHKFYVSVTNINYSEKEATLQIKTRIFIDDLEALLMERYGIDAQLATDDEAKLTDDYIKKYLKTKLLIQLNGKPYPFRFLGKKYDNDVVICYMEIEDMPKDTLKSIAVENEILTDLYDEQKNLVHIKYKGEKKSFVLIKSDVKGMLKL